MPLRTRSLLLFQNHFPSPATMLQAELLLMVLMVQALRASQAPSLKEGKQIVTFQKSFSNNIYWLKTAVQCINKIAVSVIFRKHVKSNKVHLSQVCHTKHLYPRVFQGNLDSGFRKGTSDLMKTLYLSTFHCLWDKKKRFFPSSWFPAAEVRHMHAASSVHQQQHLAAGAFIMPHCSPFSHSIVENQFANSHDAPKSWQKSKFTRANPWPFDYSQSNTVMLYFEHNNPQASHKGSGQVDMFPEPTNQAQCTKDALLHNPPFTQQTTVLMQLCWSLDLSHIVLSPSS